MWCESSKDCKLYSKNLHSRDYELLLDNEVMQSKVTCHLTLSGRSWRELNSELIYLAPAHGVDLHLFYGREIPSAGILFWGRSNLHSAQLVMKISGFMIQIWWQLHRGRPVVLELLGLRPVHAATTQLIFVVISRQPISSARLASVSHAIKSCSLSSLSRTQTLIASN